MFTKKHEKITKEKIIDNIEQPKEIELEEDISEVKREKFPQRLPTRESIHHEIENTLIDKLYKMIETIEVLPNGELNFKPYQDSDIIRLEALLERKFEEKIFNRKSDINILEFLERIKIERDRRDLETILRK
ncbi:MAG: hypothetical protein JXA54_12800 [Candidatus Heimdallarchaeota archaeon]|nr:hypothetical protein [Candidatus Heimdallarchaeota archaeon]